MKNILTYLLILAIPFYSSAQDYVPMVEATACWGRKYVDNISLPPVVEQRGFFYINSNSKEIISGLEYWSLFNEYDPVLQNTPIGYLREDIQTQQVFYLNESENFSWLNCGGEEILLYDFSAEVGDTVYHCPNSDLYYVVQSIQVVEEYINSEIDFFNFGGGRVYEVFSSEFNFSTIYEGVGSNIGPIHEYPNVSTPGTEVLSSYTFECAFILDTDDFLSDKVDIFPNPTKGKLNIQLVEDSGLVEMKIYDLSGQIQKSHKINGRDAVINIENLPRGLYFITGYDKKGKQIFTQKFVKQN